MIEYKPRERAPYLTLKMRRIGWDEPYIRTGFSGKWLKFGEFSEGVTVFARAPNTLISRMMHLAVHTD